MARGGDLIGLLSVGIGIGELVESGICTRGSMMGVGLAEPLVISTTRTRRSFFFLRRGPKRRSNTRSELEALAACVFGVSVVVSACSAVSGSGERNSSGNGTGSVNCGSSGPGEDSGVMDGGDAGGDAGSVAVVSAVILLEPTADTNSVVTNGIPGASGG